MKGRHSFGRGRLPAAVGAVLIAAVTVGGCGGSGSTGHGSSDISSGTAKRGGVLRIAQKAEPATLNPSAMVETPAVDISAQINEPLYKQNEAGKIVPLLATGYTRSKDGLTWTIRIRRGVRFSDGTPLTASDVVFSLDAARKSAAWAGLWEEVESVKVLSPTAVQVRTTHPMAAMLADLTSYSAEIVPDHYGGMSEKKFAQHPIGTGPFALESWAPGNAITLVRNQHYWQKGVPAADEVVFTAVQDDNSRISQLRGGSVDLIGQPALSQLGSFEQSTGFDVGNYGIVNVDALSLNLNMPLFQHKRVREAVSLAVDRESLVKAALNGFGEPADSYLPPTVPYYDAGLAPPARNLAKARSLLAEAVKQGVEPTFTLDSYAGNAYDEVAVQVLQQNLEEIGFHVKLQALDEAALIEEWLGGNADAVLGGWYAGVPDPSEITSLYLGAIAAPNGLPTKPFEALAAQAAAELDPGKRRALYDRLQEMVTEEAQLIPLDYQPAIWVTSEKVTGLEVNSVDTIWLNRTGFED